MMIIPISDIRQDTIPHGVVTDQVNVLKNHDSVKYIISGQPKDTLRHKSTVFHKAALPDFSDTTSVCSRNFIADPTFYDFNNFILRIGFGSYKEFPFVFTEKAKQQQIKEKAILIKQLKPGTQKPEQPFHADWMILIILVIAFLYSLVRSTSKSQSSGFTRYFLFRGINDPVSRDMGGLFHWQSTLLNLVSFIIIGLFSYSAASFFNIIPAGIRGIILWLIAFGIIISAVTLRHVTCILTGSASGQREVFTRYLLSIYQSYRFGALFIFVIVILIFYTRLFPVKHLIMTGIFVLGLMYLIRVIRLFIIFLNRNISIFYLILYLCALEILPVLIVVRYFTGLV
jgi:Domain of unknown function (DUF4271)